MSEAWKERPYALIFEMLEVMLKRAWCRETAGPGDRGRWTPERPSIGQCAVTTASIYLHMTENGPVDGLKILRAAVDGFGSHYWLRLPDGTDLDLTRDQFPEGTVIPEGEERTIEYLLDSERAVAAATRARTELLDERIEDVMERAEREAKRLGLWLED